MALSDVSDGVQLEKFAKSFKYSSLSQKKKLVNAGVCS